jgi:hypothetical protein
MPEVKQLVKEVRIDAVPGKPGLFRVMLKVEQEGKLCVLSSETSSPPDYMDSALARLRSESESTK